MSIHRKDFDKTKCMYFLIKDDFFFLVNTMKFGKKLAILPKQNLIENLYKKKYLKAEKKINTKEGFHCACARVILIDLVYRKDENYYLKYF